MKSKINLFSDLERSSSDFNEIEFINFDELKNDDCSTEIGLINFDELKNGDCSKEIDLIKSSSNSKISSSYVDMTECDAKLNEQFNDQPIGQSSKSTKDNLSINQQNDYQPIGQSNKLINDNLSINQQNDYQSISSKSNKNALSINEQNDYQSISSKSNMDALSIDEQNIKSIAKDTLILKVSLRDELINLYTDISAILLGKKVQDKLFSDSTREKFYELVIDLGSLYLKLSLEDNSYRPDEEILELNSKLRIHLIDNLIKNRTFYLDLNKFSNDEKRNLAKVNKKLISYLNNLPAINNTFDPNHRGFNEELKKQIYENQSRYPTSFMIKDLAYRTKESEAMIEDWFCKNRILENLKSNSKFIPTCSLNSLEDDNVSEYCKVINSSIKDLNESNEKQLISDYITNLSNDSLSEINENLKNQLNMNSNEKLSENQIKINDSNQNNHLSTNTSYVTSRNLSDYADLKESNNSIKSESKNLIEESKKSSTKHSIRSSSKDSTRDSTKNSLRSSSKNSSRNSTKSSSKDSTKDSTRSSSKDSNMKSTRDSIRDSSRDSNMKSNNSIKSLDQINNLSIKSSNSNSKIQNLNQLESIFDSKFKSIDNDLGDLKNSVTRLETMIAKNIMEPNTISSLNNNDNVKFDLKNGDKIEFGFKLKRIDKFLKNATSFILKEFKCSNLNFILEAVSSNELDDSFLNFVLHYQNIDHNNDKHLVNVINRFEIVNFENTKKTEKTNINYLVFQSIRKSNSIKIIGLKDLNKLGLIKDNSIKLKYTLNAKLIEK